MVTKLRRFSAHSRTKSIAFVLAVLLITAAIVIYQLANLKDIDKECLQVKEYGESKAFHTELMQGFQKLENSVYYGAKLEEVPFYYYVTYNGRNSSNTGNADINFYKQFKYFYTLMNGYWKNGISNSAGVLQTYSNKNVTAYVAFGIVYMEKKQLEWDRNRELLFTYYYVSISLAALGLLLAVYLICFAGKIPEDRKVHPGKFDKVYTDITIALFGYLAYFLVSHLEDIFSDDYAIGIRYSWRIEFKTDFNNQFIASLIFFAAVFVFFITAFLILLLSLVRKLRARTFLKHSMLCKAGKALYQAAVYLYKKSIYKDIIPGISTTKALYYRQLILFFASTVLLLTASILLTKRSVFALLPLFLETGMIFWYSKGNNKLYSDIDKDIQVHVEDMLKSERMKVALITNVSHDLKTPLTSIISYIDLLSKEEGLSEAAKDYIRILQAKSDRLKNIVVDLFDLAKSTSGDISVEYDVIDLKKLIEQTLAEMGDRIEASRFTIKTKFPEAQLNVKSDGKKLYRVFQNIIDNALKYSLQGTRIFIELETDGKDATVTVKNTAGYEMDFTAEEILQRFTRGDLARSEEGSGLGLSIAESFTKVCGGNFTVKLDGDQFKVIITFHLVQE